MYMLINNLNKELPVTSQNLLKNNSNKIKLKFNMPENPMLIYQCRNLLVNYIGD